MICLWTPITMNQKEALAPNGNNNLYKQMCRVLLYKFYLIIIMIIIILFYYYYWYEKAYEFWWFASSTIIIQIKPNHPDWFWLVISWCLFAFETSQRQYYYILLSNVVDWPKYCIPCAKPIINSYQSTTSDYFSHYFISCRLDGKNFLLLFVRVRGNSSWSMRLVVMCCSCCSVKLVSCRCHFDRCWAG